MKLERLCTKRFSIFGFETCRFFSTIHPLFFYLRQKKTIPHIRKSFLLVTDYKKRRRKKKTIARLCQTLHLYSTFVYIICIILYAYNGVEYLSAWMINSGNSKRNSLKFPNIFAICHLYISFLYFRSICARMCMWVMSCCLSVFHLSEFHICLSIQVNINVYLK